jgi:hypothetical protein
MSQSLLIWQVTIPKFSCNRNTAGFQSVYEYHWVIVIICFLFKQQSNVGLHFTCFRWLRNSLLSAAIEPSEFQALLMLPALWNVNWLSLLLMVIFTLGCLSLKTSRQTVHEDNCVLIQDRSWEKPRCYRVATTWRVGWHVCLHWTTWRSFQWESCESASMGSYSTGSGSWNPLTCYYYQFTTSPLYFLLLLKVSQ